MNNIMNNHPRVHLLRTLTIRVQVEEEPKQSPFLLSSLQAHYHDRLSEVQDDMHTCTLPDKKLLH